MHAPVLESSEKNKKSFAREKTTLTYCFFSLPFFIVIKLATFPLLLEYDTYCGL